MNTKAVKVAVILFLSITFLASIILNALFSAPDDLFRAEKGILDLSSWDYQKTDRIALKGEWEFYWNKLLAPEDIKSGLHKPDSYPEVPGVWTNKEKYPEKYPSYGYATYRIRVILPTREEDFAISIREIISSWNLYINDDKKNGISTAAADFENYKASFAPEIAVIPHGVREADIIIQIANYYSLHAGFSTAITLGTQKAVFNMKFLRLTADFILFGSVFILGIYHIGLFILRPSDKSTLFLGLSSINICLRTLLTGERFLYTFASDLGYQFLNRLESLTVPSSIALIVFFFVAISPQTFNKLFFRIYALASLSFALMICFLPINFFVQFFVPYELLAMAAFIFVIIGLSKMVLQGKEESETLLVGIFFLIGTIINDSLAHEELIDTFFIHHVLLFTFFFMLAYVLSKNFTNAFYRIEKLSIHLNTLLEERKKYQGELEQRVKERTNDLIKAKEAAENANKSKSEFLAKMSHEMRTPLNCILGFCEIVQSSDDEKQKKEYIRQVIKESERLLSLINELLDLSKIEAGKLKLENISFNLEDLMDTITSTIGLHAKNKGLDFQILISDDVPKVMEGDPIRLRQILINLAGNAVKFTEKGYVHINIVLIHKSAAETELKFIIKDSGIGIPKNKRLDIFENFVQADSSTTRKYGGSGLGTSIAKQLVQMMNGKIDFHSEENNGSTFWFTAVFKTSDQSEKNDEIYGEAASPPVLSGKNILIVDDYEPNRQIIKLFLEKTGCYFDEAENGREAVESCRINKYHLILMDVQMPELDGNKASTEIRTLPNYKKIPIIGMTANAFRNDIEASLEAGMNDVLTKPVRKKNLYSVITAFSAETAPSSSYKTISSRYEKADNTFNTNDAPLDYYGFVEELGNDRQAANQIIESFLIKAGEQLINIKKSLSEEDFPLIHREAHTIKGGALNLLASGLASISAKIEAEAKAGNSEHITDNLETLKLELEKLSSFMKDK